MEFEPESESVTPSQALVDRTKTASSARLVIAESRGTERRETLIEAAQQEAQLDVKNLDESTEGDRNSSSSSSSSSKQRDNADTQPEAATISGDESSVSSERSSKRDSDSVVSEAETRPNDMSSPPAVQAMERTQGYDPFRIPSSVFERGKSSSLSSSTPVEWSIASNESLFSLHVGNASFSREHFAFGELGFLDEARSSRATAAEGISEEEKALQEAAMLIGRGGRAPSTRPPASPNSSSSRRSRLSGASDSSARSFAFPILLGGMKSESMRPESSPVGPRRTQKPSFGHRWFPCLSDSCYCSSCCSNSSCSSLKCSWPRINCCSYWPPYYCFHCTDFRRHCCCCRRWRCRCCSNCCCY